MIEGVKNQEHKRIEISAFVVCRDEFHYIENCIRSLAICAEIVVVDSGSTDGTDELIESLIAEGFPIRFIRQPWLGYAGQKQFALEQCTQPWCFNIDADERPDRALIEALPGLLQAGPEIVGWRIARRPYLIGYGYSPKRSHERRNLRLIRRGRGRYDLSQQVHEGIVPDGRVRNSEVGSLLHFRPLVIDEQILKENRYSTLKADQRVAEGSPPRIFKLIVNPPTYFLRLYLRNGLWRCGVPGFIQAMTGAVYSFLTEAKIYQRNAARHMPPHDDLDMETPR